LTKLINGRLTGGMKIRRIPVYAEQIWPEKHQKSSEKCMKSGEGKLKAI
jgi:hypothetical protein